MSWLKKFTKDKEAYAILRGGVILSLIWIIIVTAYFFLYANSTDARSIDKIGSFLQGVFAPLAFGWLVVAVLLQTKELGLQREELTLNRDELRKSVEQFAAQTQLMREEQKRIEQAARDASFEQRIALWAIDFKKLTRQGGKCRIEIKLPSGDTNESALIVLPPNYTGKIEQGSLQPTLGVMTRQLREAHRRLRDESRWRVREAKVGRQYVIDLLNELHQKGSEFVSEADTSGSPSLSTAIARLNVRSLVKYLRELRASLESHSNVCSSWDSLHIEE